MRIIVILFIFSAEKATIFKLAESLFENQNIQKKSKSVCKAMKLNWNFLPSFASPILQIGDRHCGEQGESSVLKFIQKGVKFVLLVQFV